MGRVRKNVRRTNVSIPEDTLAQVEFYLTDPVSGKLRYAALSTIVTTLLQAMLQQLEKPGADPVQILRRYGVDIGSETVTTEDISSEKE